jgi:transcription initiation factor IIE alpha subunit
MDEKFTCPVCGADITALVTEKRDSIVKVAQATYEVLINNPDPEKTPLITQAIGEEIRKYDNDEAILAWITCDMCTETVYFFVHRKSGIVDMVKKD